MGRTAVVLLLLAQLAATAHGSVVSNPSNVGKFPAILGGQSRNARRLGSNLHLRGGEFSSPLPIAADDASKTSYPEGTVTIRFSIRYGLDNGVVVVCGPHTKFGSNDPNRAPKMQKKGADFWELTMQVPLEMELVTYNYVVLSNTRRKESQINVRTISLRGLTGGSHLEAQDMFRSPKAFSLATSCFSRAIFGRGFAEATAATENKVVQPEELVWAPPASSDQVTVRFECFAPRVEAGHSVGVVGKPAALGGWSEASYVPMVRQAGTRLYVGQATVPRSEFPFEYKHAVFGADGAVACKEKGDAHKAVLDGVPAACGVIQREDLFNYPAPVYKSAGVAIPVSGIKTTESSGIGEFLDLKKMVDWCAKTGLQLIQILPINDSGEDPSPYSAASSFALHPSYIRPKAVCEYYSAKFGVDMSGTIGWAKSLVEKLNGNWRIDHPKILDEKKKLMDAIFDAVGQDKVLADPEFQTWLRNSESWVKTYAAFKVQLAKEKMCNNKWFDSTTWGKRASEAGVLTDPNGRDFGIVARTYFIQYHLHVQLLDASRYAEQHGVAIKGDIPIGVTRCSSDVWAEPNLFKLDTNAGAPGNPEQNWGFPPYNWNEMHRDGCRWWRRRLAHMEQYFHAYRIDHVLGFFRMWEIPKSGGGGRYVPEGGLREAGLRNLGAIQTASNMLICGEDLGNVPPEVPPVLNELGILGLRIQRWCDGRTWDYPLLCVAASSCHDCSPCRLWWNEEWGGAEGWYNYFVGQGNAPGGPPDWISQKIIRMHFESSALWTINPIQDYIDMWGALRSQNPKNDMINRPGQTDGCWVWRCHKRMEDLIKEDAFNAFIAKNIKETGRGRAY